MLVRVFVVRLVVVVDVVLQQSQPQRKRVDKLLKRKTVSWWDEVRGEG